MGCLHLADFASLRSTAPQRAAHNRAMPLDVLGGLSVAERRALGAHSLHSAAHTPSASRPRVKSESDIEEGGVKQYDGTGVCFMCPEPTYTQVSCDLRPYYTWHTLLRKATIRSIHSFTDDDTQVPHSPFSWLTQLGRPPLGANSMAEPLLHNAPGHGQDATVYATPAGGAFAPATPRGGAEDSKAVVTGGWGYLPGPSESVNVVMAWVYRVRCADAPGCLCSVAHLPHRCS